MNFDKASAQLYDDARKVRNYVTHPQEMAAERDNMLMLVGRLEGLAAILAGLKDVKLGERP